MTYFPEFELTQPTVSRFFTSALNNKGLVQGYVFKGRNTEILYNFALSLAKVLNCQALESVPCNTCPNCKWVLDNAHPAVMTLSRLTYLYEETTQSRAVPTQIKGNQITQLISQLGHSSQYHRVIIFTDMEEVPESVGERSLPPFEWRNRPGNEVKTLQVKPLNRFLLNATSANRLLKTLEEPPANTLFIFLTDNEENILETIVSRCQVIPFMATPTQANTSLFSDVDSQFYNRLLHNLSQREDVYSTLDSWIQHQVEESGRSHIQGLEHFQLFLKQQTLRPNLSIEAFTRYADTQKRIEESKRKLSSKVNTEQTLQQLFYQLAQSSV